MIRKQAIGMNLSGVFRKIFRESIEEELIVRWLKEDGFLVVSTIVHVIERCRLDFDGPLWHEEDQVRFPKSEVNPALDFGNLNKSPAAFS